MVRITMAMKKSVGMRKNGFMYLFPCGWLKAEGLTRVY